MMYFQHHSCLLMYDDRYEYSGRLCGHDDYVVLYREGK